ncbi:hypothetical protein [Promicromonospora sukumoe]|uniref:hypothetical protein n=1 Tax=Promicromonospora sukumoe TaxID=88382 RepID=UPI0003A7F899|nr:hypothetical protein [Promicromonospora sukumoe]
MPRLVLLNGLPGVGKSALAAAWAARRPGTLNLDIDVVRALIIGPPGETAGPARTAAYAEGLREVARTPGVLRLVNDDLARAVAALEALVEADTEPGGSAGPSPLQGRKTVR